MSNNSNGTVKKQSPIPTIMVNDLIIKIRNFKNIQEMMKKHPYLKDQLNAFKKMKPELVFVTPELASEFLERNTANRKMNIPTVNYYEGQMESDSWVLTHQGIAIDVEEIVQDGQHRLRAIIESGKPQLFLVYKNMPKESFTVLDTHKMRKTSDSLYISGIVDNSVAQASIADFLLNMIKNQIGFTLHQTSAKRSGNSPKTVLSFVNRYRDEIEEATRVAMEARSRRPYLTLRIMGGYYFLFRKFVDPVKAAEFMDMYTHGANLTPGHPILCLHEVLEKDYSARKHKPVNKQKFVALFIKAWNYFITGELYLEKGLKFNPSREAIPEVLNAQGESIESSVYMLDPDVVQTALLREEAAHS